MARRRASLWENFISALVQLLYAPLHRYIHGVTRCFNALFVTRSIGFRPRSIEGLGRKLVPHEHQDRRREVGTVPLGAGAHKRRSDDLSPYEKIVFTGDIIATPARSADPFGEERIVGRLGHQREGNNWSQRRSFRARARRCADRGQGSEAAGRCDGETGETRRCRKTVHTAAILRRRESVRSETRPLFRTGRSRRLDR
jgi:hypothetical protein